MVCLASVHCGGATEKTGSSSSGTGSGSGTTSGSSSESSTDSSSIPAGTIVGDCGAGGSCPSGSSCFYAIGSCSATAQCVENPGPGVGECDLEEELCGCDGQMVETGCAEPNGFATGPTTGTQDCLFGSPDGGARDTGIATPPSDASSDLGPCSASGGCPAGASCYFPIGDCASTGECFTPPQDGCGAEESLCGCNGESVTTGCGFPEGYASGPATGAGTCEIQGPVDAG